MTEAVAEITNRTKNCKKKATMSGKKKTSKSFVLLTRQKPDSGNSKDSGKESNAMQVSNNQHKKVVRE